MRDSSEGTVVEVTIQGRTAGGSERGAVMMFILMMMGLVGVVTTGIMLLIAADLSAGIRQLHAVRVFNIAEAGVHYAIGRLQTSGASSFSSWSGDITDGSTVLGTAAVTVKCLDGTDPPCTGLNAQYRRIISTGTLPAGGPTRTVVVVVEGYPEGLTGYAICAYDQALVNQGITIYGDVGSNGVIDLLGPPSNYAMVRSDPSVPPSYSGSARAVGAINCSQGCATQVQGTTTPYAPGPVCPTVTLPTFSPGVSDLDSNTWGDPTYTMNGETGYAWRDITVRAAGTSSGCTGSTRYRDLVVETGAAGTTTVVNVRKLVMERCARLILAGDGNLDLRVSELTGQAVFLGQYGRFGMLAADPSQPVPAGRLTVSVRSSSMDPAAVQVNRASIVSGAWVVPNGEFDLDQAAGMVGNMYGGVLTLRADIDRNFIFTYVPNDALGTVTYGNFNRLRSWKDQ